MAVAVAEPTCAGARFSRRLSFAGVVSKFVPFTVTAVPDAAKLGVKLVIVGAPLAAVTTKPFLAADPVGDVTPIVYVPGVRPAGTVATRCVAVAAVTDDGVPLNERPFAPGVALNPVPSIVTVVPTAPLIGENALMATPAAPGLS